MPEDATVTFTVPATGAGGEGVQPDATADSSADQMDALVEIVRELNLAPGQLAERLKASRKWEQRAKANAEAAQELEAIKLAGMSDPERALAEAEKRGRHAARTEYAQGLAAARIEAALTGVVEDPAVVIEDLNISRFVTKDGDVDAEKVAALRAKYEALAPKPTTDLKQGVRQAPIPAQDGNAWFQQLVAESRKH